MRSFINVSVSGEQDFVATMKDRKLLLSVSRNYVLPLAANDEVCAKLQTLKLENLVEETGLTLLLTVGRRVG